MTTKEQAPLIDVEADRLDVAIGKHIAKRAKLEERLKLTQAAIEWQTRRIRELSLKRSVALNFQLPDLCNPDPSV